MENRSFDPLSRRRTLVASAMFGAAVVSGAWMLQHGTRAGADVPARGDVLFDQVRTLVTQRYLDTIPIARAYQYAVEGMIAELGDPYSTYLSSDRLSRLTERTSGTYAGIGLQVDVRDGFLVVVNPLPGGPGERAGILTGDRIVEIDGKAVRGWTPDEVQRLLRGAPGSTVALMIEHPGTPGTTTVKLERAAIHQSAVRHAAVLPGKIGYITLSIFSDSTADELTTAIDSLQKAGARSLMLDLRANPGGLLEQGVRVADLFLDRGAQVASTHGRAADMNHDYVDSSAQRWASMPMIVLVDDRTASAAEIVAGALQDNDRAAVVGSTTFGKGSAQTVFPLGTEGAVKLTTARWYTPVGRSISRVIPLSDDDDGGRRRDKDKRPEFKTAHGRTVFGGGGITPDVLAGDTAIAPENMALMQALGRKVGQFRDALASYALSVKASRSVTTSMFPVTQPMLDDVYKRMTERGVNVPRGTYDDARPLVSRLLAYEVERYVFGADAELYRKAMDDKVIAAAGRIVADATSPNDVVERASKIQVAQRDSAKARNE